MSMDREICLIQSMLDTVNRLRVAVPSAIEAISDRSQQVSSSVPLKSVLQERSAAIQQLLTQLNDLNNMYSNPQILAPSIPLLSPGQMKSLALPFRLPSVHGLIPTQLPSFASALDASMAVLPRIQGCSGISMDFISTEQVVVCSVNGVQPSAAAAAASVASPTALSTVTPVLTQLMNCAMASRSSSPSPSSSSAAAPSSPRLSSPSRSVFSLSPASLLISVIRVNFSRYFRVMLYLSSALPVSALLFPSTTYSSPIPASSSSSSPSCVSPSVCAPSGSAPCVSVCVDHVAVFGWNEDGMSVPLSTHAVFRRMTSIAQHTLDRLMTGFASSPLPPPPSPSSSAATGAAAPLASPSVIPSAASSSCLLFGTSSAPPPWMAVPHFLIWVSSYCSTPLWSAPCCVCHSLVRFHDGSGPLPPVFRPLELSSAAPSSSSLFEEERKAYHPMCIAHSAAPPSS